MILLRVRDSGITLPAFSSNKPTILLKIEKISARCPTRSLTNTQVRQAASDRRSKRERYVQRILDDIEGNDGSLAGAAERVDVVQVVGRKQQ